MDRYLNLLISYDESKNKQFQFKKSNNFTFALFRYYKYAYLDRLLSVSVFVKFAFSVPDMSTPSSWNSRFSLLTLRLRLAGAVVRPITGFFVLDVRCSFFNSFFLIRILKNNYITIKKCSGIQILEFCVTS